MQLGRKSSRREDVVNLFKKKEESKIDIICWLVKRNNREDLIRAKDLINLILEGGNNDENKRV